MGGCGVLVCVIVEGGGAKWMGVNYVAGGVKCVLGANRLTAVAAGS